MIENSWPIPDANGSARGSVVEGPVGSHLLARLRVFRYEIRRWRNGVIADIAEAVDSPRRLSDDQGHAQALLEQVGNFPPLIWGREELVWERCGTPTRLSLGSWPAVVCDQRRFFPQGEDAHRDGDPAFGSRSSQHRSMSVLEGSRKCVIGPRTPRGPSLVDLRHRRSVLVGGDGFEPPTFRV